MKVQIDQHALERARERGASQDEIKDVLVNGFDIPAQGDRKGNDEIKLYSKKVMSYST